MNTGTWKQIARAASLAALFTVTLASTADAAPKVGERVPQTRAAAIDGKAFDTRATNGKITLIFYEDKDAVAHNQALKNELHAIKRSPGFKPNVRIIAVADVSAWDFWPAKGFVQDAIRSEERKLGAPIYLDWSGEFGKAFKITKGASNIVLVGEDGKVMLTHEGVAGAEVKDRIKNALRKP
ncbi:MAG: hypothetical protein HY898_31920 [Deltaproteobacteria bacterium]|nr:hypothetical protein [Deltaproteobacteria bacterium]